MTPQPPSGLSDKMRLETPSQCRIAGCTDPDTRRTKREVREGQPGLCNYHAGPADAANHRLWVNLC